MDIYLHDSWKHGTDAQIFSDNWVESMPLNDDFT